MAREVRLKIVPLERHHDAATFDCGVAALNEYLKKFAWQNQSRYHSTRTFVAARESQLWHLVLTHPGSRQPDDYRLS